MITSALAATITTEDPNGPTYYILGLILLVWLIGQGNGRGKGQ